MQIVEVCHRYWGFLIVGISTAIAGSAAHPQVELLSELWQEELLNILNKLCMHKR